MLLSALPQEILQQICDHLGDEVAFLLATGDRSLASKLKSLQRLSIILGKGAGFLSFYPLYSLLDSFASLKSLEVYSSDPQQLWTEKLKPKRLPSSLTRLKLGFWNSVVTYIDRASLYQALPNLLSLELVQELHPLTAKADTGQHMTTFNTLPSTLRHLRLLAGKHSIVSSVYFTKLPTSLETFSFDGVFSTPTSSLMETFLTDLQRYDQLSTLHIVISHYSKYIPPVKLRLPPSITDLSVQKGRGFDMGDFCWSLHLPHLRTLVWRSTDPAKWEWFLEFPYSLRSISANFESIENLSPSALADLITTLTARNDNHASLGPSSINQPTNLFVPARMTYLGCLEGSHLPYFFKFLYGTSVRLSYLEVINEDFKNAKKPTDEIAQLDRSTSVVEKRYLLAPIPKVFSSLLTPELLTSVAKPLLSLLVELECHLSDTLTQRDMKHFSSLKTLKILTSKSKVSTLLLSNILPPSVTRIRADHLIINAPLEHTHLERLKITSPVDVTWIPTLPATLKRLDLHLLVPIDIRRKSHRDALLSFPSALRRLSLRIDQQKFGRQGLVCPPGDFNSGTHPSTSNTYRNKRVADESEALELLTRNLRLVRLHVDVYMPMRPNTMSLYEELPEVIHNWLSMRIPFYRLCRWEPVLSRSMRVAIADDFIDSKIEALSATSLSVLSTSLSANNPAIPAQSLLQERYLTRRGIYVERYNGENIRKRKRSIASEPSLHWYLLTAFHVSNLLVYGFHWAMTGENVFSHLYGLCTGNTSILSSIATHSWISLPLAFLGSFGHVYKDLNAISSAIIAPYALRRLIKEVPRSSSLLAPINPYPGGISPLTILMFVFFSWPYSPVGWLGPIVAEWFLMWATSFLLMNSGH